MNPTRNNLLLTHKKDGLKMSSSYIIEKTGPDSEFKVGQEVLLDEEPIKNGDFIISNDKFVVAFKK